MYTGMKNYGSARQLGARTEGKTRAFNIPKHYGFFMFLRTDIASWLSQLLFPTSDSLLPPILEVGKILCSYGCQLCYWISRNTFAFLIKGTDETWLQPFLDLFLPWTLTWCKEPQQPFCCPVNERPRWTPSSWLPLIYPSPSSSSYLLPDSSFWKKITLEENHSTDSFLMLLRHSSTMPPLHLWFCFAWQFKSPFPEVKS